MNQVEVKPSIPASYQSEMSNVHDLNVWRTFETTWLICSPALPEFTSRLVEENAVRSHTDYKTVIFYTMTRGMKKEAIRF